MDPQPPEPGGSLPRSLELTVGDRFRVPVTGAGSQGYRWQVTVTGDRHAIAVTVDPIVPADAGRPGAPAGSYPRELRVDALAAGRASVELVLVRSGGRVRERHVLAVRVS